MWQEITLVLLLLASVGYLIWKLVRKPKASEGCDKCAKS
ncbi:MAG: hypothetical protein RL407_1071 [Bacteroidota bacterium]|jgi:hypothetical protein